MDTHETSEERELTVCELDQVSGGGLTDGKEMLFSFGLVGLALYLTTTTINEKLHR
jgi:hypothetical protein